MTAKVNKIELQRKEIEKARAALASKSAELRNQQRAQKQQQESERTDYYQKLTTALVDTFCLYGNGLREVPSKEHVSLIIKGAGKQKNRGFTDQIMVFTKKDINACANSKLTAEKLLTKADKYQF